MNVAWLIFTFVAFSDACDLNQTCNRLNISFNVDGVCYKLFKDLKYASDPIEVSELCREMGMQLATIKSEDVVKGLVILFQKYIQDTEEDNIDIIGNKTRHIFVQVPNGNVANYLNMNVCNSTDNNSLSVYCNFRTDNVPTLIWEDSNPTVITLTDQHEFILSRPFCELIPERSKTDCGLSLSTSPSFEEESLEQCADTYFSHSMLLYICCWFIFWLKTN